MEWVKKIIALISFLVLCLAIFAPYFLDFDSLLGTRNFNRSVAMAMGGLLVLLICPLSDRKMLRCLLILAFFGLAVSLLVGNTWGIPIKTIGWWMAIGESLVLGTIGSFLMLIRPYNQLFKVR